MKFPKKIKHENTMTLAEYQALVDSGAIRHPKKKWLLPKKSTSMKPVVSEDCLQRATNDLIDLRRWAYIRFENWFMAWMRKQHPKYQKHFFGQIAGKMPDNFIIVELGKGYSLCCKLELKTEDSQGRAVGKLHGKQQTYAMREEWPIARNTRQVECVLNEIEKYVEQIKHIFA